MENKTDMTGDGKAWLPVNTGWIFSSLILGVLVWVAKTSMETQQEISKIHLVLGNQKEMLANQEAMVRLAVPRTEIETRLAEIRTKLVEIESSMTNLRIEVTRLQRDARQN